jgi:glycine cleavage system transcriptional repressor
MAQHYLLWASGADRPGIVASLTDVLYALGANLEDSSMMRLGSEFAIFLIFSGKRPVPAARLDASLKRLRLRSKLSIGVKPLSAREAVFRPARGRTYIVSVHGHDRPGIVRGVTKALARRKFNITDLSTHRTTRGVSAGYILFIEGELSSPGALAPLKRDLARLASSLKTRIGIRPVDAEPL